MISALASFTRRTRAAALAFRSGGYEGAGAGRRWRGASEITYQARDMTAARGPIGRRARALVANNPLAASAVEAWTSNLVGTGIKPQSQHPDPKARAAINVTFERWTETADWDALLDFYGLQAMAVRRMVVDGDVFVAPSFDGHDGNPLRLRLFDSEQCSSLLDRILDGGTRIISGVEFDKRGRRVAFHLYEQRPELNFWGSLKTIRLPVDDLLQVFSPLTPGQVRGLSWFAPILLKLADYDASTDAQLMRQKIASLLTGFVLNQDGAASPFDGSPSTTDNTAIDSGMEPGTLKVLSPGQDVKFSDPALIGQEAIEFLKLTAREIAAGVGVPYEVLTGDLTQVNFSSIRAGLIEFRRRVEAIQYAVVVHRFCGPVWKRWIAAAVLSGEIDGRGFARDPEAFSAVKWIAPKREWVDPLKDSRAEIESINAGTMSRREAVASRGYDIEALDEEIAADRDRAKRLGLHFGIPTSLLDPTQEEAQ